MVQPVCRISVYGAGEACSTFVTACPDVDACVCGRAHGHIHLRARVHLVVAVREVSE
jgi:hypothetical protein